MVEIPKTISILVNKRFKFHIIMRRIILSSFNLYFFFKNLNFIILEIVCISFETIVWKLNIIFCATIYDNGYNNSICEFFPNWILLCNSINMFYNTQIGYNQIE